MKFEVLNNDSIIVELSDDDMKSLNITYEEMDYSKVETKRVIWTILSRAGRTLGRELNPTGRLLVEAMRRESGGCVLFFSVENEDRRTRKSRRYLVKKTDYIACQFENVQALLSCAKRIAFTGIKVESSLYENKNKYRLLVCSQTSGTGLLRACLTEFGEICGESAVLAAHTAEHWHCITDKNAVEKISSGRGAS